MNKEELALEVLKLTYRHDQKPVDIIERAQALLDFVIGSTQASAGVQKKKPVNN